MPPPHINIANVAIKQENPDDIEDLFCICCLQQTGRYFSLKKCDHFDFLDVFPVPKVIPPLNLIVCYYCHSTLKKLKQFKKQVQTSFEILVNEAGNFAVQKHENSRLTIHKTVHLTVPDKNIKRKTILIPKKKNIETAMEIIKTNTTSLTSNNLKTMTDALLTVASGHLNLEPQNSKPVLQRTDHDYTNEVFITEVKIENIKSEYDLDLNEAFENETLSGTAWPDEKRKEDEGKVTVEEIYDTSVLPKIKIEPQDEELKCMEEDYLSDSDDQCPPNSIVPITLTAEELKLERLTTLQSRDYLKFLFRCDNCLVVFNFKENIEDHRKRKHEMKKGRAVCEICHQWVPYKDLIDHKLRHYNRLECSQCKKRFALYDEAHDHYKAEHMLSKRQEPLQAIDDHSQRKRQRQNAQNKKMMEDQIRVVYHLKQAGCSSMPELIPMK